jgi:hypothetical protein
MQSSSYVNASPEEQALVRSAFYAELSQDRLDYEVKAAIWRSQNDLTRLTRLRDDLARVGISHKVEQVEEVIQTAAFFAEWTARRQQVLLAPEAEPAVPQLVTAQQLVDNGRLDGFVAEVAGTHDLEEARYNAAVAELAFNPATLRVRDVWVSYLTPEMREVDAWRN